METQQVPHFCLPLAEVGLLPCSCFCFLLLFFLLQGHPERRKGPSAAHLFLRGFKFFIPSVRERVICRQSRPALTLTFARMGQPLLSKLVLRQQSKQGCGQPRCQRHSRALPDLPE